MNILDGLVNFATGLGLLGQSKAAGGTYQFTPREVSEIRAAYRSSWLARACVDMPVDDAFSAGRLWQGDQNQINLIEAEEKRLGWKAAIVKAQKKARLDGGAAILLDDASEDLRLPFEGDRIGKGGLRKLIVLGRYELSYSEIEDDLFAEGYGRPREWSVSSGRGIHGIHPSRLVFFAGDAVHDEDSLGASSIWGDSVLESRLSAIRDADSAIGNVAEMLYEASVDVIGIDGLQNAVAAGQEDAILRRLTLMRQGKSLTKLLVRDKEEEYERKAISFGSVPDLLRESLQVASGATQIPATRLLGRSPAGLSATGDGDERVYFDRLDAMRGDVESATERLDRALVQSALGAWPEGTFYEWPPLRQQSGPERADVFSKTADAMSKVDALGVLTLEEKRAAFTNTLIEGGFLPGLESAMAETGEDFGFDTGGEEGTRAVKDLAPRTLYVRRDVLNADEIIAWAKSQGFGKTLRADDMHVTITYSREPVDWMKMGEAWREKVEIAPGGPRAIEAFGEDGSAKVLAFASHDLKWRHEAMREAGASWDHPEYQPHITISYDAEAPDVTEIEPYQGRIVLGPEVFEEVREDWQEALERDE